MDPDLLQYDEVGRGWHLERRVPIDPRVLQRVTSGEVVELRRTCDATVGNRLLFGLALASSAECG